MKTKFPDEKRSGAATGFLRPFTQEEEFEEEGGAGHLYLQISFTNRSGAAQNKFRIFTQIHRIFTQIHRSAQIHGIFAQIADV